MPQDISYVMLKGRQPPRIITYFLITLPIRILNFLELNLKLLLFRDYFFVNNKDGNCAFIY